MAKDDFPGGGRSSATESVRESPLWEAAMLDALLLAQGQRTEIEARESRRQDRVIRYYEVVRIAAIGILTFFAGLSFFAASSASRRPSCSDACSDSFFPVASFLTGSLGVTGGCIAGIVFLARKYWEPPKKFDFPGQNRADSAENDLLSFANKVREARE